MCTASSSRAEGRFDLVGFGEAAKEHLSLVPRYPKFDSKLRLSGYAEIKGGAIAAALAAAAGAGARSRLVARLGSGPEAEALLDYLRSKQIDLSAVVVEPAPQMLRFAILDAETGSRTDILFGPQFRSALEAEHIQGARMLLIDGYQAELRIPAAVLAHAAGLSAALLLDTAREQALLESADILVGSAAALRRLLGRNSTAEELLESAVSTGAAICAILSCDEALARSGQGLIRAALTRPELAAGRPDAPYRFSGGFLGTLLTGGDIGSALESAAQLVSE